MSSLIPGSPCPSCIVDVHIDVHGNVASPGKGPEGPVACSARVVDARAVIGRLRRGVDTSTPCLDGPGPTQFDTMDEAGLVSPAWMNEPVVGPSPPVNTRDRVRWDDGVDPHCVQVCVSRISSRDPALRESSDWGYKAKRRYATKESARFAVVLLTWSARPRALVLVGAPNDLPTRIAQRNSGAG